MALSDIYRATLVWQDTLGQFIGENVWHYQQGTGQVAATAPEDLLIALSEDSLQLLEPVIGTGIVSGVCTVVGITNPTESFESALPTQVVGAAAGQVMPLQLAMIVHWRTGLRGRSYRGRTFLVPGGETQSVGAGGIDSTTITAVEDWATAHMVILSDAAHGRWDLVVHSETVPADTPVTSFSVNSTYATLRKRRLGSD